MVRSGRGFGVLWLAFVLAGCVHPGIPPTSSATVVPSDLDPPPSSSASAAHTGNPFAYCPEHPRACSHAELGYNGVTVKGVFDLRRCGFQCSNEGCTDAGVCTWSSKGPWKASGAIFTPGHETMPYLTAGRAWLYAGNVTWDVILEQDGAAGEHAVRFRAPDPTWDVESAYQHHQTVLGVLRVDGMGGPFFLSVNVTMQEII